MINFCNTNFAKNTEIYWKLFAQRSVFLSDEKCLFSNVFLWYESFNSTLKKSNIKE